MTSLLQTFPRLCFKWQAESFESFKMFYLFHFILNLAKKKVLTRLGAGTRSKKEKEKHASLKKMTWKNARAVSVERPKQNTKERESAWDRHWA